MTTSSDGGLIKLNSKFIAFSAKNPGGQVTILTQDKKGKIPTDLPCIRGHHGPVLDLDFMPFNENILATCSEDTTVQLWKLPGDKL
jgi:WD40 repeat protein